MNKRLEQAINEQINAEIWSAYLYLSMSAYFGAQGFNGF
ncbi:MAG TPA: ferritin, partial [Bacteroidales bacterium]|nr:ferritin [Bacteroidales bacterium]